MTLISRPNIPQADVTRLSQDDTRPIAYRQDVDNQPLNMTGHVYLVQWLNASMSTELTTTADANIRRPNGATAGLLEWDPPADFEDGNYTFMVYRVTASKKEPKLWGAYNQVNVPPSYVDGLPLEPSTIVINYDSVTGQYTSSNLFTVAPIPMPSYASVADAKAADMMAGHAQSTVVVTDENGTRLFLKIGASLFEIPLNNPV